MLWLPTAAAEPRHVIRLPYIRPVWMNNEECLSLQNIPASLPLPRALLPAQTGSCWASGTGAVGREGGGTGEHRGDWRETGAPLTQVCSERGGFFGGENSSVCSARNIPHSICTDICVVWVTGQYPNYCQQFQCKLTRLLSPLYFLTSSVTMREKWLLLLSAFFKKAPQNLHMTCRA